MKVLIVEPGYSPYEAEIAPGLDSLQSVVGGSIQAVYPYEDPVAIICNEDSKFSGMPLNRALYDDDGRMYDIIAGNFLMVGLGDEDFTDLPGGLMAKYAEQFKYPEQFFRLAGEVIAVKQPAREREPEIKLRLERSEALASSLDEFFRQASDAYTGLYPDPQAETANMKNELLSGKTGKIRMRLASAEQDEHLNGETAPLMERISAYEKEYGISAYSIYQLSHSDSTDLYRFMSYGWLEKKGLSVDRDNYLMVYSADLAPGDTLDTIYEGLNLHRPDDFKGHSLSVSDVVVLHEKGTDTAHYVDSFGFKEIPGFLDRAGQPEAGRSGSVLGQLESAKKQAAQAEPKAPDKKKDMERS